jgi:hypothetical protein
MKEGNGHWREAAVNIKNAQALGLAISREFQVRADELIE